MEKIITTSDEDSPFEVTLKQSPPYDYAPRLMIWKDLLPAKIQEQNDHKTDKTLTQVGN